ncbi:hypothetical protein BGZ57DRAFT_533732 [Hyaloscypha finlandica]|nr:hypothetical protein BGZ57DRAFT_533732 [Hyaloscypha finlandica]
MRRSRAHLEDSKLEAETRRTYKGSARISLDVLYFQSNEHRDLDRKHVDYLKGCFQRDKCRRLEKRNHIEAAVDQPSLDAALRSSDVSARELLTNEPNGCPKLSFPAGFKLRCLHGQHRIQAAREFLLPHDKWWTVDLYTSDLNDNLKQCLHEQHSNEDKPSDGEAYCKIRNYHFQGDTKSEMRWKACLRGCRLKNLKELLADEELTAGFDALLDIPGLWDGMMMTTLQKMMAMGCKDETLHYLSNIKKGLLALVGGDEQALKRFDRPTITALESRAPGASTADAQFLRNQGRAIFSAFTDHERDQILNRLPMVDGLILTLSSFFKDLNYLQLLIDCLKRLVIVPKRRSVCETIQSKYTGVNQQEGQVKIQVTEDAEDTFVYKSGTDADRVDLGWRQLVALAMRYYPYMPRDPIKEDTVKKATTRADQAVLRQLADLAYQLGFASTQIYALRQHSSSRIAGDDDPQFPPLHVTSGAGIEMRQRSGIPRTQAYKEDRYSLFINHLHDTQAYQGEGITSFFVRKSVYLAFFGRPDEASIIHSLRIPPFSSGSAFDSTRVTSELRGASENSEADDRHLSNQERLEQERRELRRIEETLEREDLQERLAQALQAQQNLEQEKRRQQQHEKQEQERQEEERRRQGTREQGRREQEALVQGRALVQGGAFAQGGALVERRALVQGGAFAQGGALVERRALNDSERTRKRHTQIDMESLDAIGNQRGLVIVGQAQERQHYTGQEIPGSNLQSGRELVLADPTRKIGAREIGAREAREIRARETGARETRSGETGAGEAGA